jgi:Asp-tRNA(Asn)/Glu-tRNA(Gln) amidotransferase C subunit
MRRATSITRSSENIIQIKEKKELTVEEDRRNQLDAKLKEMIKHLDQVEAKRKEPITQSAAGNAIRRREGEKAKRFFCLK